MKTLLTVLLFAATTICAFGQNNTSASTILQFHETKNKALTITNEVPHTIGSSMSRFGSADFPFNNLFASAESIGNIDIDVVNISPKFTITLRRGDQVVRLSAKDIEELLKPRETAFIYSVDGGPRWHHFWITDSTNKVPLVDFDIPIRFTGTASGQSICVVYGLIPFRRC